VTSTFSEPVAAFAEFSACALTGSIRTVPKPCSSSPQPTSDSQQQQRALIAGEPADATNPPAGWLSSKDFGKLGFAADNEAWQKYPPSTRT